MNINLLLYIVLFSQIMFLSYYYPRRKVPVVKTSDPQYISFDLWVVAPQTLFLSVIKSFIVPSIIVSALLVATVDYLVPIIGVTAGVVFLNEVFNRNIIISGIFIFISLVISTKEEFTT